MLIVEAPWKDNITSYTTNKGDEIAMCIRSKEKEDQGDIHKLDKLMYVAIHELAHVMSSSYSIKSHNDEFYRNFKFLLHFAKEHNLIKKVDYFSNPEQYCGIKISEKLI